MEVLTTCPKVVYFIQKKLLKHLPKLTTYLLEGNMLGFERALKKLLDDFYNQISQELLIDAAEQLQTPLQSEASISGLGKLRIRPMVIQIATGYRVKVQSLYAGKVPAGYAKSRHLLANYWTIISQASPGYIDKVCLSSAVCSSYETANQLLRHFGVKQSVSRVRKLSNDVAAHCKEREVELALASDETLHGKRVVIGMDGGRTRTRAYDGATNGKGNATYQTPWCEPKLFVIHILDEQGQLDRQQLPIYGCRFGEEDILGLLERYLQALGIEKCKEVQIVADGAPWIWNHMKNMLLTLGVDEEQIVETLDYYHAVGYVHSMIEHLPRKYSQTKRKESLAQFKQWLWEGKSDQLVKEARTLFKRPSKLVKRWLNYLEKHVDKTQYDEYQLNSFFCGSGIIESGIRRIINLRFKNASTFWDKNTVENLFFFRETFLSFRWNIFMENLVVH